MDILKTFEIFWRLPEKLFAKKFFKVCHIETTSNSQLSSDSSPIQADLSDDKNITLNVYNNEKVYSLLASVLYKRKMLQSHENKDSEIYNISSIA
jgi:hypothetical protein